MNEKAVSVKVAITPEDYCELQKSLVRKQIFLLVVCVSVPFFILISVFHLAQQGNVNLMIPALIIIIICFFSVVRPTKKVWRRQYNNHPLLRVETLYVIKSDGIETYSDKSSSKYDWSDFYAFDETKQAFLIYYSEQQLFYIPKYCFHNDENDINFARQCFSNLVNYKIKQKTIAIQSSKPRLSTVGFYMLVFLVILVILFLMTSRSTQI